MSSNGTSRRMLVALAHPDDEAFGMAGTIVKYTQEGVDVSLICATNGDVGSADEEFLQGYESMAELRMEELRCAAEELGFSDLYTFGYRDSGMMGTPDNEDPACLWAADLDTVTEQIVKVIRETRPQIVVTFDPYGGYGHPDHIKMHRATTRAFDLAGDASCYPEHIEAGLEPYQPQKLYYMTFNRRMMKFLVRLMSLLGMDPEHMGRNNDMNFLEIAEHSYPIHAYINTRHYTEHAERARMCHASQMGGFGGPSIVARFVNWLRHLFAGMYTDTYMRAVPPVPNGKGVKERDLFAGIAAD